MDTLKIKKKKKDGHNELQKQVATAKRAGDVQTVRNKLDTTKNGAPKNSIKNIKIILENDPMLEGKIRYNVFSMKKEPDNQIPWRMTWGDAFTDRNWEDRDFDELMVLLDEDYDIANESGLRKVLTSISMRNTFHPILEYFESISWDGEQRVENFIHRHLGALDSKLNREISKMFFKGAVARIKSPGIKYDLTLALIGSQGRGKSWIFSKMAGSDYFTDSIGKVGDTDSYTALRGKWIVELGEGAATKHADIERIKNYLTAQKDVVRPKYGREEVTLVRQNVFIITANDDKHLKDTTGNRRYLPVKVELEPVSEEDSAANLKQDYIDQVWAEALEIYSEDDSLVMPEHTLDELEQVRRDNTDFVIDPEDLKTYLNTPIPDDWNDVTLEDKRSFLNGEPGRRGFENIANAEGGGRKNMKKRMFICPGEIIEELLEYDNYKVMKMKNKKGYHELINLLKQTQGWREAHPAHGDPETKRFGNRYKTQRKYFVRE